MQKKYIVDGNLKDDTGYHTTGDIMMMEEYQAVPLVAIGRLKPAVEDITPPQAPADAAPDGFPDRNVDQAAPAANAPAVQPPTPPVNVPLQTPLKQPTQEQIAKDMEQLG
jgi:hypothetical protein